MQLDANMMFAVALNREQRLEVFARGTDKALWHGWHTSPANGWSGWYSLGGMLTSNPTVARNPDGRLEVFVRGTNGALYHMWQVAPNFTWTSWSSLGGIKNRRASRRLDSLPVDRERYWLSRAHVILLMLFVGYAPPCPAAGRSRAPCTHGQGCALGTPKCAVSCPVPGAHASVMLTRIS
jgi:hypothetical protein